MTSLDARERAAIESAIQRFSHEPGPLLVVLHAVQDTLGHIPPAAVPEIATALNLSRAEVHGVVSFYHYFRTSPPGRRIVQVCRAEACQARGGAALEAHARERLGVGFDETTPDGAVTLEAVYCLGNCATGPSVRVDGRMYSNVTPERFDALTGRRESQ